MSAAMLILAVEISFLHQKWLRERADRYAPGTRLLLELGELIPAMDYLRALQLRRDLKNDVRRAFVDNDLTALVSSTSAMTAIPFDQLKLPLGKGKGALSDRIKHVVPFNLTGQPAVSIPCGFADNGLPVGLQIVGRPYADADVLRLASTYQNATSWHEMRPPL
jgi:aspartyl-tRNA(Asn)/glutamyl-tRNA(Gln) amidotransferase subunit A